MGDNHGHRHYEFCSDCVTNQVCYCSKLKSLPNLDHFAIGLVVNNPLLYGLTPSLPAGSKALEIITILADRLGVVAAVKDRAIVIYKKIEDHGIRNLEATLAACLCIASRLDKELTVTDICSVTDGATWKEIDWAYEYIVDELLEYAFETGPDCCGKQSEEEYIVDELLGEGYALEAGGDCYHMVEQSEEEYVVDELLGEGYAFEAGGDCCDMVELGQYCSILGMNNQAVKAVEEAILKSEGFDIRSNGISIAAAVIYIVTQLSDDKKPLKDISFAIGVAEGRIRSAYKNLYPHISKIIPSWYATDDDLEKLCSP